MKSPASYGTVRKADLAGAVSVLDNKSFRAQDAEGKELLSSLRKTVQDRRDERGSTAVDIYSKFGEDGNEDAIRARNHYIRGLVSLAEGDKLSARADLSKSLDYNPSNVWAKHFLGTSAK